ncbi:MAG TPA: hypothetical protein DIT34_13925 [Acinetobacter ursingii]|jgi:hypothetical protein|nr:MULTISPECIES: hypothetical protein [Acinetobacter]ENX47986.1 hypothetical protein F943_02652 [Acinetobacter ursingii NIPH 706]EXD36863.1 hypothetical protein J500_0771 [Acinetobacter sp. 479375]MCH2005018.1 hypothetical protein [Acinetobacter ursingii]MCH2015286.1 hypothetical protein [Acinetobacter ursingii]MCU4304477.1 hypothetical protein [Acinetobacter ursingii]
MSYKHNNLFAMRENYWNDVDSGHVKAEKQYFCDALNSHGVFEDASLEDAKYFFFTLPSIIIVKGYALGFMHRSVQAMIDQHILSHVNQLKMRESLKIKFRM